MASIGYWYTLVVWLVLAIHMYDWYTSLCLFLHLFGTGSIVAGSEDSSSATLQRELTELTTSKL